MSKKLEAHLFICTNERVNGKASCGLHGGNALRDKLKEISKSPDKGWAQKVRINKAGCLGRCSEGAVCVLYPQGEWFTHLDEKSAPILESAIDKIILSSEK